ncbi:hypothetical protein CHR29_20565 [Pseudomonas monteilii]|uniref:Uncharacterized protein n=1 Tax=Pseudomonas monteilii TaxID=76759 RepID=A0AAP7FHQ1_9PSED|nr:MULTISPECIES: DUF6216 family protein [Pseudomonas]AYN17418.1 hypothetical protein CHR29_20565 [Pseudomonas monteilii]AYN98963.1 hypothetical protein D8767_08290 [Pseudomonas sp. LTGT-11-2Z]MBA1317051.1 hypothetical protein [Pseudomonas monteilii]MBA6089152.1 hypothetical protein [Pseudomonas monteilii]MBA6102379.1 hypothetical protein [Pseudomonas monteilii]
MTNSTNLASSFWSVETLAPLGGVGTLILIGLLLWFIYRRAGSLYFLRDLIWRSFGGTTEFDSHSQLNTLRRELREIEFFRYEFNIPANNLHEACLAHRWIVDNGFAPGDLSRNRAYIDWSDFDEPKFATARFSRGRFKGFLALLIVLFALITPLPVANQSEYLMVSLKNDPASPAFYLSQQDIKFEMWFPDEKLTLDQCRSSESLAPFTRYMPEEKLDTICSFFMAPDYAAQVEKGVKGQRALLTGLAAILFLGLLLTVLKLSRMERAQKLYKVWQARVASPEATTATAPSPADTASA